MTKPADPRVDLMFERSGPDHWTSRNNNYVIKKVDAKLFAVIYMGQVVSTTTSKMRAVRWAEINQAMRLGL